MEEPYLEERPTPPSLRPDAPLAQPPSLVERLVRRRGLLASPVSLGLIALVVSGALSWTLTDGSDDDAGLFFPGDGI